MIYEIICEECNGKFISSHKKTRFCSNSCRAINLKNYKNFYKGNKPYNYDYSKIRNCLICGKKLHHNTKTGYCLRHYRENTQWKNNISKELKGKTGGYRKGSGRGKHGWYKGYWCDSSWELAYVIYNLEHKIDFIRNINKFKYIFENEEKNYFPDFIENGKYIEVKGYNNEQFEAKKKYFKKDLIILDKNGIKKYIDYVENKYGKDFIKLYE